MAQDFELACPASLAARGIATRLETEADQPLLQQLYVRHRWAEFAPLPMNDAQKLTLLLNQYAIQHQQYRTRYACPRFHVLEQNGALIGRLMLGEVAGDLAILDILIEPSRRGEGIGAALLAGLLEQAGRVGRTVTLHVDKANPARRLYERLGFRIVGDMEIAHAMAWVPDPAPAS